MSEDQPTPGDLPAWAKYWQARGAMIARAGRDNYGRDAILAEMYQEAACNCYQRARQLVTAMERLRG